MKTTTWKCGILAAICVSLLIGFSPVPARSVGEKLDICSQVGAAQLKKLYRKPLYPTATDNGCFWSEKPGGMAFFDINVHKARRPLREYYNKNLPASVKLEKINGIGDEGLVNVSEGTLGVVVIRKGKLVLQSAVTFLDIKPGSKKQAILWGIYRRIVQQL